MRYRWQPLILGLVGVALGACTGMGLHSAPSRADRDFGPPDTLALCLLVDEGITEPAARAMIDEAWRDEGHLYGITINVVSITRWRRASFTMDGIMGALLREPLGPQCDRLFALVGRHAGDVVWGLLGLPEVLGAVDDNTLTHGYAVVSRASLNQLFMSPTSVVRHELYHLLGCDEHFDMVRCYDRIAALKRRKRQEGADFFPAWDAVNGRILASRDAVNAHLRELTGSPTVPTAVK
jgi:hypothetical protein